MATGMIKLNDLLFIATRHNIDRFSSSKIHPLQNKAWHKDIFASDMISNCLAQMQRLLTDFIILSLHTKKYSVLRPPTPLILKMPFFETNQI